MTPVNGWLAVASLVLFLVMTGSVSGQEAERDPTVAPGAGAVGLGSPAAPDGGARAPLSVVVRAGKPYLVWGTRLLPVGARVGDKRLVRITETEVWFRDGAEIQKVARFAGVVRAASVDDTRCKVAPRPGASAPQRRARVAPTPRTATSGAVARVQARPVAAPACEDTAH